ncbi:DUF4179 domain-containing protein [Flavonifractor sp. An10]|uniref:DUF4179 domain-containing protein n=1 Tax=Flavonifractor sp. An10 TaxID=1965537 RepID=UPI000B375878|nr:DUF4179 domain-containing protein [Flavonifractor sp. An10]OUQ84591.1 hypothetical protein B5E42_01880 [Flavonifractor sp. An10]
MNEFDKRMRGRARAEDCPIPADFDGRLETLLETLPQQKTARRFSRPRKFVKHILVAALAAIFGTSVCGVFAASGYPVRPGGFGSAAEGFQPYSAQVGASVTDQGYTLSLDGIGMDEAFITLYATITGEEPIPKDEWGEPELWALRLRAEGEELEFWGQDQETEWVDDYTLKVSQRCPVLRTLPEQVELQIYSDELFYGVSGDWSLNLLVDKSAPDGESLVVEPNQAVTLHGGRWKVSKVVVAPSGGGLVLTGAGDYPPSNFFIRDDQGNYLYKENYGTVSSPLLPISNFIAFYGGRTDMEFLTIVPYERVSPDGEPAGNHRVFGSLDGLPLTDGSAEDGYTLLTLDIGEEQAVATFQTGQGLYQYGGYGGFGTEFGLLDGDGAELELGDTYLNRDYDRETGIWTVTISYPDADPAELARAERVWFWQPDDTIRVLEDQAVTIDLS